MITCEELHLNVCKKCESNVIYPDGINMRKYRALVLDCGHKVKTNLKHITC